MAITASLVKELRDKTNAGMMDCKKALTENSGDIEEAAKWLREKGISKAAKKAEREAKEGIISAHLANNAKTGILLEVNCETDFVAKNENFQNFVNDLGTSLADSTAQNTDEALAAKIGNDTADELVKSKVIELGENLQLRRFTRFTVEAQGAVASYIHLGGKVGVLLHVTCEKDTSPSNPAFQDLVKDLTLHIAASAPASIDRSAIPTDLVEAEKDLFRKQMENSGKPANIIEKIVEGKLGKFYSEQVLLEQGFVKEPDTSIQDLIAAKGKEIGDNITLTNFARYAVGE